MPQINLSTLSGQELRQRLDSSRARGDAALAYEILREMEARRAAEPGRRPLLKRRPAEPRIVDVDMADPLERDDDLPPMPHWRAPELVVKEPAPRAEPARDPEPALAEAAPTDPDALPHFRMLDAPLTLRDPDPVIEAAEPLDLRLAPEADAPIPPKAPRPRHGLRVAAGFAAGITAGVAVGWFAADFSRGAAPLLTPQLQVAGQANPTPAVLEVVAEPAAPPAEPLPAQATQVAEAPAAEPVELPGPASPTPVEVAEAAAPEGPAAARDACAPEPTPADREICADPALQQLQRDLRRAYAAALDAHEDRALLRERQLAWREARNDVTDPGRLARLYEQRIRKLEAAAAEARAQR